jgi:hypothetical protein
VLLEPSQNCWNVPLTIFEIPLVHGDLLDVWDPK